MPSPRPPGVLPLRPLTLGELLDAAVSLLRGHAAGYLTAGLALAAAEQAVLYPLRAAAGVRPPWYLPGSGGLGAYWSLLAFGLGTEAAIIALLGGLAARAAGPALLGERVPTRRLFLAGDGRLLRVVPVAAVVGLVVSVCALAGLLPWLFGYGLLGLAAPAVVVDRLGPGRALLRSLRLAARGGLRAVWIRLAGYFGWLAIRLALGSGGIALAGLLLGDPDRWPPLASAATWCLVNAVAYPTLACLDAVLHLETRMRVEGLDITLGRALRRGEPAGPALAVPTGPGRTAA